jgi:hypothetical protein
MVFWRKRKNQNTHEQEADEDRLLHHKGEPDLEPATDLQDPD